MDAHNRKEYDQQPGYSLFLAAPPFLLRRFSLTLCCHQFDPVSKWTLVCVERPFVQCLQHQHACSATLSCYILDARIYATLISDVYPSHRIVTFLCLTCSDLIYPFIDQFLYHSPPFASCPPPRTVNHAPLHRPRHQITTSTATQFPNPRLLPRRAITLTLYVSSSKTSCANPSPYTSSLTKNLQRHGTA